MPRGVAKTARKKSHKAPKNKADQQNAQKQEQDPVQTPPPDMPDTQAPAPAPPSDQPVRERPAAQSNIVTVEFPESVPYLIVYEPHEIRFYHFGPAVEEPDTITDPQTTPSTGVPASSHTNESEQTTSTTTESSPVEGHAADKGDGTTSNEALPDGATTNEATTNEATTNEAVTNEATSNEATPKEATSNEATPNEATSNVAIPNGPTSVEATTEIQTQAQLAEQDTTWIDIATSMPAKLKSFLADEFAVFYSKVSWLTIPQMLLICFALCFWVTDWRRSDALPSQSGDGADYIAPAREALLTAVAYVLPSSLRQTLWYGLSISGLTILLLMWLASLRLYFGEPQSGLDLCVRRSAAGLTSIRVGIIYCYRLPGTLLRQRHRLFRLNRARMAMILLEAGLVLLFVLLAWFGAPRNIKARDAVNIAAHTYVPSATTNGARTTVTRVEPPTLSYATLIAEHRRHEAYISEHFAELWEAAGGRYSSETTTSVSVSDTDEHIASASKQLTKTTATQQGVDEPITDVESSTMLLDASTLQDTHTTPHANSSTIPVKAKSQSAAPEEEAVSSEASLQEDTSRNTAQATQAAPTTSYTIAAVFTHSQAARPTTIRGPVFVETSAQESVRTTSARPRPSHAPHKHSRRPSIRRFGHLALITLGFRPLSLAQDEIAFCDQCHQRHGWTVMIAEKKIDFDLHNH